MYASAQYINTISINQKPMCSISFHTILIKQNLFQFTVLKNFLLFCINANIQQAFPFSILVSIISVRLHNETGYFSGEIPFKIVGYLAMVLNPWAGLRRSVFLCRVSLFQGDIYKTFIPLHCMRISKFHISGLCGICLRRCPDVY